MASRKKKSPRARVTRKKSSLPATKKPARRAAPRPPTPKTKKTKRAAGKRLAQRVARKAKRVASPKPKKVANRKRVAARKRTAPKKRVATPKKRAARATPKKRPAPKRATPKKRPTPKRATPKKRPPPKRATPKKRPPPKRATPKKPSTAQLRRAREEALEKRRLAAAKRRRRLRREALEEARRKVAAAARRKAKRRRGKQPKSHDWAQREVGLPQRGPTPVIHVVKSAGEVLMERLLRFFEVRQRKGHVRPPEGHDFGDVWVSFSERAGGRQGIHDNQWIGLPVTDETIPTIRKRIIEAAKNVAGELPGGLLYASIHMIEYGHRLAGSPGEMFFEDADGFFVQSFEGIPASSRAEFLENLDRLFVRIKSNDRSAVIIEHVTVRSFQEGVGYKGYKRRKRRG